MLRLLLVGTASTAAASGDLRVGSPQDFESPIPGSPPHPGEEFAGCRFAPRCHLAFSDCVKAPIPLFEGSGGREARCLLAKLP
jgi:oligopeptide/dipeptide ABC transporter ATP-binding protein